MKLDGRELVVLTASSVGEISIRVQNRRSEVNYDDKKNSIFKNDETSFTLIAQPFVNPLMFAVASTTSTLPSITDLLKSNTHIQRWVWLLSL